MNLTNAKMMIKNMSPIQILLGYLMIMSVLATISWGGDGVFFVQQIFRLIAVYSGMRVSFFVLSKVFVIKDSGRWENRVITSLILYLLFDPMIALWVFFAMGLVAETISRCFRSLLGPIANPAAASALVMILFGYYPGWWGMSFAPRIYLVPDGISLAVFLTLAFGGYAAYKYKKLLIVVIAGLTYFMLTTLLKGSAFSIYMISEGTVLFYLLIMVVEPKTSPAMESDQRIYGLIVGVVACALLMVSFADPYIGALVVANITAFLILLYKKRNKLVLPQLASANDQNKTI
jgi:hypothetical protein